MDLATLDELVAKRAPSWTAAGVAWQVIQGRIATNPAKWLALTYGQSAGQLTVWASGEAALDWGANDDTGAGHYDLASREDLEAALDVLELELGIH